MIAVEPRLRWIWVTVSRGPVSVPLASTGPTVVSPPGFGAGDHGDRDRPARGEQRLLLVAHARHQLDGLPGRGHDEERCDRQGRGKTAKEAKHDPFEASARARGRHDGRARTLPALEREALRQAPAAPRRSPARAAG